MNKVEAIRAMLEGKTVARGQDLLRCNAATGAFEYTRTRMPGWMSANINAFEPDGYELYIEPPREVTRAEAWAALDLGKTVKLVDACGNERTFSVLLSEGIRMGYGHRWTVVPYGAWQSWASMIDTKFYILEGEP